MDEELIYSLIAARVIRQAVQDFRYSNIHRGEATNFFDTEWFGYLCDIVGVNSKYVVKLAKDPKVKIMARDFWEMSFNNDNRT
jgi:hypothetical protein